VRLARIPVVRNLVDNAARSQVAMCSKAKARRGSRRILEATAPISRGTRDACGCFQHVQQVGLRCLHSRRRATIRQRLRCPRSGEAVTEDDVDRDFIQWLASQGLPQQAVRSPQ
jgi:hypothetical protein